MPESELRVPVPEDFMGLPAAYLEVMRSAMHGFYGDILMQAARGDVSYDDRRAAAKTIISCGYTLIALEGALGHDHPPIESFQYLATLIDAGKTEDLRIALAEPADGEDEDTPQGAWTS